MSSQGAAIWGGHTSFDPAGGSLWTVWSHEGGLTATAATTTVSWEQVPPLVNVSGPGESDTLPDPPKVAAAENSSGSWSDHPGLEGVEMSLQRVKRAARELAGNLPVDFSEPRCFVYAEEGAEDLVQATMEIILHTSDAEDVRQFRRQLFDSLVVELQPQDLARMALLVRRS